jgi:hypothetical protein
LRSKGFAPRQMMSLLGPIRWQRRVGRCPQGCAIPQVAPLESALGVQPHQRTSDDLQALGCALAVFVPFATAARLLGWYCGSVVSPRAVWCWVQAAGHQAMEYLHADLDVHFVNPSPVFLLDKAGDCRHSCMMIMTVLPDTSSGGRLCQPRTLPPSL